jgi:hypothetical protein
MRSDSPYRYHLLVGDRQLGPYDRRTIVGMRIRNLIDSELQVRRSDGHRMTVGQLLADRFEMADADTQARQVASPPASGFWPTFLMDCGGSLMRPGALGFIGKGELRFQGEFLRLSANRKSGLVSTRQERVKIMLTDLLSASSHEQNPNVLLLKLRPSHAVEGIAPSAQALIALDDAEAVRELLELINIR